MPGTPATLGEAERESRGLLLGCYDFGGGQNDEAAAPEFLKEAAAFCRGDRI